jgi:hypothetical protein
MPATPWFYIWACRAEALRRGYKGGYGCLFFSAPANNLKVLKGGRSCPLHTKVAVASSPLHTKVAVASLRAPP